MINARGCTTRISTITLRARPPEVACISVSTRYRPFSGFRETSSTSSLCFTFIGALNHINAPTIVSRVIWPNLFVPANAAGAETVRCNDDINRRRRIDCANVSNGTDKIRATIVRKSEASRDGYRRFESERKMERMGRSERHYRLLKMDKFFGDESRYVIPQAFLVILYHNTITLKRPENIVQAFGGMFSVAYQNCSVSVPPDHSNIRNSYPLDIGIFTYDEVLSSIRRLKPTMKML
ncbi:hypothetical protein Trydic_g8695 [Trypoxylus dichotomus]